MTVLIVCIVAPFWTLYGASIGFVLQTPKMINVKNREEDWRVPKTVPFKLQDMMTYGVLNMTQIEEIDEKMDERKDNFIKNLNKAD